MHIDLFNYDDIEPFLALAATEGWVCDRWEFDFLLRSFPSGCLVARCDAVPAAAPLLDHALARAGKKARVVLDVPAGNIDAAALLYSRGFTILGSAVLMCQGKKPEYDPARIYALASMGSMG